MSGAPKSNLKDRKGAVGRRDVPRPDLFFALVGPVGSDLKTVADCLETQLSKVRYKVARIKLSEILARLPGNEYLEKFRTGNRFAYYKEFMKAGTRYCRSQNKADAIASISVAEIKRQRKILKKQLDQDGESFGLAFVIDSLKRPGEFLFFHQLYGKAFNLIGVSASRENRIVSLSERIAVSVSDSNPVPYRSKAEELIAIDESEDGSEFGQSVGDTFWRADFLFEAM